MVEEIPRPRHDGFINIDRIGKLTPKSGKKFLKFDSRNVEIRNYIFN